MTDASRGPGFERLRKQAKAWLKALRSGDAEALRRLEAQLPRHSDPPQLREVQQALAREQGFASWAELKEHQLLEAEAEGDGGARLAAFLEYACIFTPPLDVPSKWRRAERIRVRHPGIATESLHAAVLCGEVEHVRGLLDADPERITSRGGPQQWEPILFACYGRLPNPRAQERSLEMARLLLERGADPNAHFLMGDESTYRFSALCGTMGQGEMGQPEHPHAEAVARLLLERGADPNDGQGLYNTHLVGDDTRWLEFLGERGLSREAPLTWEVEPADDAGAPRLLDYLASSAAANGHVRRLTWLLENGADPDAVSIYDGNTCHQSALKNGDPETVELLRRHGATPAPLEGHDAFVGAVRSGDRAGAEAMLREHPEWRAVGDPLTAAAGQGEIGVVRLLLALGVDPNAESKHGHRALNNACTRREITELLLEHGADPRARAFGGTACEWAKNADDPGMARFHAERSRSLLDAVTSGHVELALELLEEDPTCLEERSPNGDGPLHELTADPALAEPLIAALLAHGADPHRRNEAGRTPAEALEEAGADDVADLLEAASETG